MPLLANISEFQVTLASNVRGPATARNCLADFDTVLARCLELPNYWEVALIEIFYPHNWCNVFTDLFFKLVWPYIVEQEHVSLQTPESEAQAVYLTPSIEPVGGVLLNGLTEPERRAIEEAHNDANAIHPVNVHWALLREGKHDSPAQHCAELEQYITHIMQRVNGDPNVRVHIQYDAQRRRITVRTNRRFALYCPQKQSLLHLLGMGVDTHKFQSETGKHMECIVFSDKHSARNPVSLRIISLMFVYSDSVLQSLVGGSYTN